ncbi:unnamed protein product, partial [Chrysoparadoxa australica]
AGAALAAVREATKGHGKEVEALIKEKEEATARFESAVAEHQNEIQKLRFAEHAQASQVKALTEQLTNRRGEMESLKETINEKDIEITQKIRERTQQEEKVRPSAV